MLATHLECFRCAAEYPMDARAYLCPKCGPDGDDPGILDVRYDYAAARQIPFESREDVFRYMPLLPVRAPVPTLAAGGTALVATPRIAARLGLSGLYLKDETRNPTRCLKDRATAIAMALALELGCTDVYCASAGNAAISLAGFAAHAGLRCHAFVPSYASATRLDWLRRFGAQTHVSSGNYDQAFAEAEAAGMENNQARRAGSSSEARSAGSSSEARGAGSSWFSRNCAFNPFLVEGKKTCALEIAERIAPDFVIAPVGDACTLGAIGKGFREARELGLIERLPRLIGVQAAGVQPMVARFRGLETADEGETAAASIAVRRPRNALRLLRELKESGGEMVAVSDPQIGMAQRRLAEQAGIVAEFTSAATLAALEVLALRGSIEGQVGVLVITGGRVD
jgi:threonine synthase